MKKTYFQPEVNVASIALQSMVLAGSPYFSKRRFTFSVSRLFFS